jgi:DNA-binding NtrC family response regulator
MLFTESELGVAQAVARLAYGNPFLPERLEAERQALGTDFDPAGTLWHSPAEPEPAPNVVKIAERVAALMEAVRARLADGARPRGAELGLYENLVLYGLYERHQAGLYGLVQDPEPADGRVPLYATFRRDLAHYLDLRGVRTPATREASHLFAACAQVRRAFHHIYANILGESAPTRRLRAAVWQSIFTQDPRLYRRALYARLGDIPTLITGPSGTGKELVARAIGLARYIPFDPATERFAEPAGGAFVPLNLSALSPTLIESELFGHRRGAFTGALQDRRGWFEGCPALGTVFLDEIGEVDLSIQVKLLRVLQTRTFQRLGDGEDRRFLGKLVAATNRDLETLIAAGRFREDLYYRLCADLIETPTLAERLRDTPGELRTLCRVIAGRVVGEEEAEAVAARAEAWIATQLGPTYPWPGNVRELEQCVRNLVIRGHYRPRRPAPAADPRHAFAEAVATGAFDADQLLRRYCTLVYAETGSYSETARRVGIDRKTAQLKVDPAWLAALRGTAAGLLDGHGATNPTDDRGTRPIPRRRPSP